MAVERRRQIKQNTRRIPVSWEALPTSPAAQIVFTELKTLYDAREVARLEAIKQAEIERQRVEAARLEAARLEAVRLEQIAAERRARQLVVEAEQRQVAADQTELSLQIAYDLHTTGRTTIALIDSVLLARQFEGTKISQLPKKGELPLGNRIREARNDVTLCLGPSVSIIHDTLDSLK